MQIFELVGSILLNDAGVESKLDGYDRKASTVSKSMGLSFSSIAGAALKVASVIGAGLGLKAMWDDSTETAQVMAQMNTVLDSTQGAAGMTQKALTDLANSQSMLTTYSTNANVASENLLLTFTNIGQKVFPDALKTVNDMSTALGQDTKSSAIQLGKALNDPITGITALQRVGVTFTQQQKDQIKAMQEAGDTAGAQKVILVELTKEFGGSAEAAGKTLPGQLSILKNTFLDIGSAIIDKVLPSVQSFAKNIVDSMPKIQKSITDTVDFILPKFQEWMKLIGQIATELFPEFGDSTKDAGKKVTDFAQNGLNLITSALTWIRDNIGLVKDGVIALTAVWLIQKGVVLAHNIALLAHNIAQIANGVATAATGIAKTIYNGIMVIGTGITIAGTVATWLATAATTAFGVAMKIATGPIGLVIAILVLLGLGIYEIVKHWDVISAKTGEVWEVIKKTVVNVANSIKDFFVKWGPLMLAVITGPIGLILYAVIKNWDTIKAKTSEIWNGIKTAVSSAIGGVKDAIVDGFNAAINFIKALPSQAVQWGKDFIQGLINGITSMISGVVNAVSGVADKIKSFLHFSTPDEGPLADYESWMPDFMSGLAGGIDANKSKVTNAIKGLTTDMSIGITDGGSGLGGGLTVQVVNQGTLVGSNGMTEFANIISSKIASKFGFSSGGKW